MSTAVSAGPQFADHLLAVTTVASKQYDFKGIRAILQAIAEALEADACILWEVSPGNRPIEERYLFVLADFFSGLEPPPAWHYLSMRSHTGQAILHRQTVNVTDLAATPAPAEDQEFIRRCGIRVFCSTPIELRGRKAAINLYRRRNEPFQQDELQQLELIAGLVPYWYDSLVNRVGFELLETVGTILQHTDPPPADLSLHSGSRKQLKEPLKVIVAVVAQTFNCLECSVYLEDPIQQPGVYQLMATQWPWGDRAQPQNYRKGQGATGYTVQHRRSVRIFDLGRYDEDRDFIQSEYLGLEWSRPIDLCGAAKEVLPPSPLNQLPPLSFMCAPILFNDQPVGMLRCCVTKTGPHYFDDRQLHFLCSVANQLGDWWGNRVDILRAEEENQRWKALVTEVARLNRVVFEEFNRPDPSEQRIFGQTLEVAGKVNPMAEIRSVRLVSEDGKELYYAATQGDAWNQGSFAQITARKNWRFPLEGPKADSGGAQVCRTGKPVVVKDGSKADYRSEIFPDIRCTLLAPISCGGKVYGVLDLSGVQCCQFPVHAEEFSELLGRQLGLYHFLFLRIAERNRAEKERLAAIDSQHKVYEDLQHQLKTPVLLAHRKCQEVLRTVAPTARVHPELVALTSLCRRSEQVTRKVGLFAAIAKGESIPAKPAVLRCDDLVRDLQDAARDHALWANPDREIDFVVEAASFEALRTVSVSADPDLLAQSLDNLLDNAGKYSYPRTKVTLKAGVTRRGQYFFLSITNRGFKISSAEVHRLVERGYRGDQAQWSGWEGTGIGLWIVQEIMRAQHGSLEIFPTNAQGSNEFRLLFPIPQ